LSEYSLRAVIKSAWEALIGFVTRFAAYGTIHGPGCKNAYIADPAAITSSAINSKKLIGDFFRDGVAICAGEVSHSQSSATKSQSVAQPILAALYQPA